MLRRAYRLVAEKDMLRSKIFSVHRGAQPPSPKAVQLPPVVWAYESPELAAFCSPEWLANGRSKTVVMRETIFMPEGHGLHDTLEIDKPWLISDERHLMEQMGNYMALYKLLSVWALSSVAPHQHVVLISTQHPVYPQVRVSTRRITMRKSTAVLQSEDAIAEM